MRAITVVKTQELTQMIERASRDGTIELDAIMQMLQVIPKHQEMVRTIFDVADEQHGYLQAGWPPPGRWTDNDQGKVTQEAHVDL